MPDILNECTTLTAANVRLNDVTIAAGEAKQLVVEGDAELHGDIYTNGVTVNGSTTLKNDVDIFADGGDIVLGAEDDDMVSGSHDLVLKADNIDVNGNVSVGSLTAETNADINFNTTGGFAIAD
ncbi:MAG: hypothetical protein II088_06910, partial [Bacteroidales bacterium]|nr:hypothetical protein [Bacteroidales bacterium]